MSDIHPGLIRDMVRDTFLNAIRDGRQDGANLNVRALWALLTDADRRAVRYVNSGLIQYGPDIANSLRREMELRREPTGWDQW